LALLAGKTQSGTGIGSESSHLSVLHGFGTPALDLGAVQAKCSSPMTSEADVRHVFP
jgi:hypothetical protein